MLRWSISHAAVAGLAAFSLLISSNAAANAPAATVSARVAAVTPDSVTVLWRFDLAEGWHLYGPFRNDTGFPPGIHLDLPEGWTAAAPRWPIPERYLSAGGILDHVYHRRLVLVQTLWRPAGAVAQAISARVNWLACKQACVPGETSIRVSVDHLDEPALVRELAATLDALPEPFPVDLLRTRRADSSIEITVPGAREITLIPAEDGPLLADLIADGQVSGERLRLRLRPGAAQPETLKALLIVHHNDSRKTTGSIVIE